MNNPITAKEMAELPYVKFSARHIAERLAKRRDFPAPYKPEVYQRPKRWLESEIEKYFGAN